MSWIHCVGCREPLQKDKQFLVTNCLHIHCSKCKDKAPTCLHCDSTPTQVLPITEIKENPLYNYLFRDIAEAMKWLSAMMTFQQQSRVRVMTHENQKALINASKDTSTLLREVEGKRQQMITQLSGAEALVKQMRALGIQDKDLYTCTDRTGQTGSIAPILQKSVKLVSSTESASNTALTRQPSKSAPSTPLASHPAKTTTVRPKTGSNSAPTTPVAGLYGQSFITAQGSAAKPRSSSTPKSSTATTPTTTLQSLSRKRSFITAKGSAIRKTPSTGQGTPEPVKSSSSLATPQAKRAAMYPTPPNTGYQFELNPYSASNCPAFNRQISPFKGVSYPPPTLNSLTPSHLTASQPHSARSSPYEQQLVGTCSESVLPMQYSQRRTPSSAITPSPRKQRTPHSLERSTTPRGMNYPSPFKTPVGAVGHARRVVPGQAMCGSVTPHSRQHKTPTPDNGRVSMRPRPVGGRLVSRSPSPMVTLSAIRS